MTPWVLLPTGLMDTPNVYPTTSSPLDFSLFSYMKIIPFITALLRDLGGDRGVHHSHCADGKKEAQRNVSIFGLTR